MKKNRKSAMMTGSYLGRLDEQPCCQTKQGIQEKEPVSRTVGLSGKEFSLGCFEVSLGCKATLKIESWALAVLPLLQVD